MEQRRSELHPGRPGNRTSYDVLDQALARNLVHVLRHTLGVLDDLELRLHHRPPFLVEPLPKRENAAEPGRRLVVDLVDLDHDLGEVLVARAVLSMERAEVGASEHRHNAPHTVRVRPGEVRVLGQLLHAFKVKLARLRREPLVQHKRVGVGILVKLGERSVAFGGMVLAHSHEAGHGRQLIRHALGRIELGFGTRRAVD
mmetsp:Transcript_27056/g.55638  ORF Transcript_27056/g.55638 Transcript_27056/m.55638 type:complete len:200 (-) Transcript_27056:1475-2074(-)